MFSTTYERGAFHFFFTNAGYVVGERAKGALDLARAERTLGERDDLRVRWVEDEDFDPFDLTNLFGGDAEQEKLDKELAAQARQHGAWGCIVERKVRSVTVPLGLDETDDVQTLHDAARIMLTCADHPIDVAEGWEQVASVWGVVGDDDYRRVTEAEQVAEALSIIG